jgi:hypothetical protein
LVALFENFGHLKVTWDIMHEKKINESENKDFCYDCQGFFVMIFDVPVDQNLEKSNILKYYFYIRQVKKSEVSKYLSRIKTRKKVILYVTYSMSHTLNRKQLINRDFLFHKLQ